MPIRLNALDLHLDPIHCEAVRQGIGETLRERINRDQREMSQDLRRLIARLPELDREHAPSLVPDMDALETH